MRILVRHAPPFRRWHRRLGERLEEVGHEVRFEAVGGSAGRLHLALERRLYRIAAGWDALESSPAGEAAWMPEVTVALAGPLLDGLVVQPDFFGVAGEIGLLAAARAGSAPLVAVRGGLPGALRLLACGRPALEDPRVSARGLEDLLPRLVTLLAQAVARLNRDEGELPVLVEDVAPRRIAAAAFLARGIAHKLVHRLGRARGRPEHWRLGLRREEEGAYSLLAEDQSSFRADPFLVEEVGRLWLFYEDYPYATGKGVIGCQAVAVADPLHSRGKGSGAGVEQRIASPEEPQASSLSTMIDLCPTLTPGISPQGSGEARVVLEEPFHISYPLVLRHRGAIYMLPETSAAVRVQLYRADPFPDRWVPDAVLIEGRRLADATPVLHEDRWWLFATANEDGGSSWDQLHLFHAPDLLGPWTPHAGNPVLIDAGAARPAGSMWHESGVLMRPAQDCRTGYGAGLAICRVDRLDEGGFRQSVVRRVGPPPGFGATGLHTFNRAAGWEVVDLKVPHPR